MNEIHVIDVQDSKIFATRIKKSFVTHNAGSIKEIHEIKDRVTFDHSDIGIKLFFDEKDTKDIQVEKSHKYRFNQNNIVAHRENAQKDILAQIHSNAPKVKMNVDEKNALFSSYYSKKKSQREEEILYKSSKVDYFARMDFDTEYYRNDYEHDWKEHYYDKFYLIKDSVDDYSEGNVNYIDWREPIASLFYDSQATKFSSDEWTYGNRWSMPFWYGKDVPHNEAKVPNRYVYNSELMLKRRFEFNPLRYQNLYIAGDEFYEEGSADPFLMEVIAANRSNHKISDIIKSIQSNQNKIIRHEAKKNMVVQGCAGSGKTMILLHRLSYLKYNSLLPILSKIKIITPNSLFSHFILDLSRSLDLGDIGQCTLEQYYHALVSRYQGMCSTLVKKDASGKPVDIEEATSNKEANNIVEMLKTFSPIEDGGVYKTAVDWHFSNQAIERMNRAYNHSRDRMVSASETALLESLEERGFVSVSRVSSASSTQERYDTIFDLCNHSILYENEKKIKERDHYETVDIPRINNEITFKERQIATCGWISNLLSNESTIVNAKKDKIALLKDFETQYIKWSKVEGYAKIIDAEITKKRDEMNQFISEQNRVLENQKKRIQDLKLAHDSMPLWSVLKKRTIRLKLDEEKQETAQVKVYVESKSRGYQIQIDELYHRFTKRAEEVGAIRSDITSGSSCSSMVKSIVLDYQVQYVEMCESLGLENTENSFVELVNVSVYEVSKRCKVLIQNLERYQSAHSPEKMSVSRIAYKKTPDIELIEELQSQLEKWLNRSPSAATVTIPPLQDIRTYLSVIESASNHLEKVSERFGIELTELKTVLERTSASTVQLAKEILYRKEIEQINRIKASLSRRSMFVLSLFRAIRDEFRAEHSITSRDEAIGRHELFMLLHLYHLHCGEIKSSDNLLFVDEGQDYTIEEYLLLSKINGSNCRFNIFGDTNQLLNYDRGISKWKDLKSEFDMDYFELNENYRNAVDINDHINQEFGYRHTSIGIRGLVSKNVDIHSVARLVNEQLTDDAEARIAVISSDALGERIKCSLENDAINSENLFFGDAKKVKGIEFDAVFVVPHGMSKNERYISYSRALSKLYIVQ